MGSKREDLQTVMLVVRARARVVFKSHRDKADKVSDAISVAFELALSAPPTATPKNIAYYACLRVKAGRQFRQSIRSFEGPPSRLHKKPQRERADVGKVLGRPGENPAALATVLVDCRAWLPTLTDRECQFLEAFVRGDSGNEIARRFGVTKARVSQIRRELVNYWKAFTSE